MENSSKLPPINTNNVHQNNNNNSTNSVMNHKSLSVLKKARKQAKAKAIKIYKLKLKNEEKGKKVRNKQH